MSVVGMAPGVIVAIVVPIVAVLLLAGVGFYVWRHALHESSPLVLAALIGLDHLIAFMIARPLLVHFLAANFSSSRATSGDLATDASIHAVRATPCSAALRRSSALIRSRLDFFPSIVVYQRTRPRTSKLSRTPSAAGGRRRAEEDG